MILNAGQLEIGDWWARCCIHDLYQIVTQDDLEDAQSGPPYAGGWHTLREALDDLLSPESYGRLEDLEEDRGFALLKYPQAFG